MPFRWDLVTPDQLGSLTTGTPAPALWFLDDLIRCTGQVVARSGDGDLVFVGRSLDSMFDLLGSGQAATDASSGQVVPSSWKMAPLKPNASCASARTASSWSAGRSRPSRRWR